MHADVQSRTTFFQLQLVTASDHPLRLLSAVKERCGGVQFIELLGNVSSIPPRALLHESLVRLSALSLSGYCMSLRPGIIAVSLFSARIPMHTYHPDGVGTRRLARTPA